MHSRHRGPGNGYRSNPREWGGAPSRVPPESSFRGGYNTFNPEYRNYNHGFGRGSQRPPGPPGPPPAYISPSTPQRRPDIFAEAGRLATEYLVARGVLPPNVFNGNWQNGSLKNLMADFRGFKQQERDSLPHHRSRNGSKRQSDEYNKPDGPRNHPRDKRRERSNESDSGREMGRSSSSLSDNVKSNLESEVKKDDIEANVAGLKTSQSRDLEPRSDVISESQPVVVNFLQNADLASNGKDLKVETDDSKTVDDVKCLDKETVDRNDGSDSCQVEKKSVNNDTVEDEHMNRSDDNMKDLKGDLVPIIGEEEELDVSQGNNCDAESLAGSEVVFKDVSVDDSSVVEIPNQIESPKCADSDSAKQTPEIGERVQMDIDQEKFARSQSLPLGSLMYEHENNEGFLQIGRCNSMNIERGGKRPGEHVDDMAVTKKPREWEDLHSRLPHSTLIQDQPDLEKEGVEVIEYAEEMQLFPASFKICDLNSVEASHGNEASITDQTLLLPNLSESKKEIDLSTSSNLDMCGKFAARGANGKEIEVIDLDDDCLQQDSIFESSERKDDNVFLSSDSFLNHARIVNEISSAQDDYGLMISDFLGNDITGPGNVNSLQNDMALDNGEGILADDESIYMSLGEIPISFLGVWEQSTQDFDNKPF